LDCKPLLEALPQAIAARSRILNERSKVFPGDLGVPDLPDVPDKSDVEGTL